MARVELALVVSLSEAKPNKMFSEHHRALVRFLHYSSFVSCVECGSLRRFHWTMLCSFQALSMGAMTPKKGSGRVHLPLAPVCRKHILAGETTKAKT